MNLWPPLPPTYQDTKTILKALLHDGMELVGVAHEFPTDDNIENNT